MIEQGKIPPQNVDAEEAVLGAILKEKHALSKVVEILSPQSFYKEAHGKIYEAITNLVNQYKDIDLITVVGELRRSGHLESVGGAYYITTLTNRVASSANIVSHAYLIKDKEILRDIINMASNTLKNAFDDGADVKDIVDSVEKEFTRITNGVVKNNIRTSAQLYDDAIQNNDKLLKDVGLTGVTTGLSELDRVTGGFQNGDFIVLAARPGMGKTALALKLTTAPAFKLIPSGFFSLEMTNRQLYGRVISQTTGIELATILRKGMNDQELKHVMSKADLLCGANIYFDDTGGIPLFELKNKIRRLVREHGVKIIIIDYLQLINNKIKNGNREGEISEISRDLKALAKELNIPIIALAQLSRASEKRGVGSLPILSDLRESGSIEQDADVVMFIHRPEYYRIMEDEQGNSTVGVANVIFAKHRNGDIGGVRLKWVGENTDFKDEYFTDYTNENTHAPF